MSFKRIGWREGIKNELSLELEEFDELEGDVDGVLGLSESELM